MRKTLTEQLKTQLAKVNIAKDRLKNISKIYDELNAGLEVLTEFKSTKVEDYIETTQGKGTVLYVGGSEEQPVLKVYVGAGNAARIIAVRYWDFLRVIKPSGAV